MDSAGVPESGNVHDDMTDEPGRTPAADAPRGPSRGANFLLLWLCAILIPVAFFVGGAFWSWEVVEAEARTGIESTATLLHEHALRSFETQDAVLTAVEQRTAGMTWDEIRGYASLKTFLTKLNDSAVPLGGIALVGPDDRIAIASFDMPSGSIDVSDRNYVKRIREGPSKSYVGSNVLARSANQVVFPVLRRRETADGSYDGALASTFTVKYFETFYESLTRNRGDLIALLRNDGAILARVPRLPPSTSDPLTAAPVQLGGNIVETTRAVLVTSNVDGMSRFVATRRIGDRPVYVRYGRTMQSIRAQWMRSFTPYGLLCIAAMALLSLFTWRTSVATRREHDARARLVREEARHAADTEGAARIRRLMEANVFGVISCSRAGILQANDAFLRIVDRSREDFERDGFDWTHATPPEQRALDDRAVAELVANGACQPYEKELIVAEGKTVPVLIGATLYERDPLVWICFVLDLTERRERETQQLFVMRELNHRSKNLLTVVRSIAGQIARTGRDWSDFNQRFSDRLSALGDSHDLLVESNWRGVSIGNLIHSQFRQFEDVTGGQIVTAGQELMLSPRAAQAIGMALYELSTNAVKYGALSQPEGRIEIGWNVSHEEKDEEPMFRMHWRESGGPRVQPPERKGFGHVVIAQMTARSLRGHVNYDFTERGVEWSLEAPLESIEELPDTPFMAKL